jgi:hypothetical protein
VCAAALVAGAGAVALVQGTEPGPTEKSTVGTTASSPAAPLAAEVTEAPSVAPGPLIAEDGPAALPVPDDEYVAAELPVELTAICEGASIDLLGAVPAYASLQTADDPLRYLDATVAVYENSPAAAAAFARLQTDVGACPSKQTAEPVPPQGDAPVVVDLVGERRDVSIGTIAGLQWLQSQTGDGTELRTVVTMVVVQNAILVISMDADSETTSLDELAEASLTAASEAVDRVNALAAG